MRTVFGTKRSPRARRDDRGAVLPLVLVMAVIAALVILPLMAYAVAVFRANNVLTDKTQDMEAVRAGARVALADPLQLFDECGVPWSVSLTMPPLEQPVSTSCHQVGEVGVIPDELIPYGAVAIQLGETVPSTLSGTHLEPPPGAATDWWDAYDAVDPTVDTIWMPTLPPRVDELRDSTPFAMPDPWVCNVFYPGTYTSPVVIDGPTYFVSGNYYFEDTVTVVGGADAVAGYGVAQGCAEDLDVAIYMEGLPPAFQINWDGSGATWVFGGDGRLVIDNTLTTDTDGNLVPNSAGLPLSFTINQRYVQDETEPGARISVMTVNGDIDAVTGPPAEPGPLDVTDVIWMPISDVHTSGGDVTAVDGGYTPSTLTAEPRPPAAPTGVTIDPLRDNDQPSGSQAAAHLSWDTADATAAGGAVITAYTVYDSGDNTVCTTDGATECWILGLTTGTSYTYTVVAENDAGPSDPSSPVTVHPLTGSANVDPPSEPVGVTVTSYADAAEIGWSAPADDGGAAVIGYDVTAYRVSRLVADGTQSYQPVGNCSVTRWRDDPLDTSCVIEGLTALPDVTAGVDVAGDGELDLGYAFDVTASNAFGTGTPSPMTATFPELTGEPAPAYEPPTLPAPDAYVPLPVVDVEASNPDSATNVEIAGYIAAPQGRIRVSNPEQHQVTLQGGIVAGSFDVDEAEAKDPETTVGFANTVLQRTLAIVSTSSGRLTSTVTVQINVSGTYKVNSWVIQ